MRNITIALANIVKDMQCANYDTSGNVVKVIPVPMIINLPEKDYYARLINHWFDQNNNENNQIYYVSKPRTNLSFTNMSYDARRQSDSNNIAEYIGKSIELSGTSATSVITNIQPTPYIFDYVLSVSTESWLHLTELLEQFLVYFNPVAQIQVKEINGINIARDLKVSITSIGFNINEDMDSNGYKQCDASIGLQVEGYLYRPQTSTSIVKLITTNYYTSEDPSSVSASS